MENEQKLSKELIELMKQGSLTIEQLRELIPVTKDFIASFSKALKDELNNMHTSHLEAIQSLRAAIEKLSEMAQGECSDEVKLDIINRISEITKTIGELQKEHEENGKNIALQILSIVGVITLLLLFFGSNKSTPAPPHEVA